MKKNIIIALANGIVFLFIFGLLVENQKFAAGFSFIIMNIISAFFDADDRGEIVDDRVIIHLSFILGELVLLIWG